MASSTSRSGSPTGSPRRRRWLRRLGIAGLSLVALVLALALGALAYLATPSGGERLRAVVVEKANAAIGGALSIREVSLRGGHLRVQGVELRDPDGEMVASMSGLELRVRLTALLRRRIDVALFRLDGPRIHLRLDESGSNLQRALAARNPTPEPEEESRRSSLRFEVETLDITDGEIDLLQRSAEASRHVHLDDVVAHGAARIDGEALGARLEVSANVAAPFDGPFHLSLNATGAGVRKDARLELELGTARLVGTARVNDESTAHARIESLVVPPEIVEAFSPSYPLRRVASLSAEATRSGDELSFRLDGKAASATARVDGTFDLATKRSRRLH